MKANKSKRFLTGMAALLLSSGLILAGCPTDTPNLAPDSPVPVTGVKISDRTHYSLVVDGTMKLTATVEPNNATNKNVTWKSNNPGVATVDENGNVTAVAVGTAIITVTTVDGKKTATCKVTVQADAAPVTGVSLNTGALSLAVGATAELTATVLPDNATNKNVTWKSDNPGVATVANGTVTALDAGTTTITVITEDGKFPAICVVTVFVPADDAVPVSGVSLNDTSRELPVGAEAKLTATLAPPDATNKNVTWVSTLPGVATVADGTVTAVAAGTTTIFVTTEDGGKTAYCTVTVTQRVTGVSLNTEFLSLAVDATAELTAALVPNNATNKNVTWTSNNTAVATVDENGTVTAVAEGTARITVITGDGGFPAHCEVTVSVPAPDAVPVTSVTLNRPDLILVVGDTAELTAAVEPPNATNKNVTWTSSDTTKATVANGTVTAVAAGATTIFATAADGGKTDYCTVEVTQGVTGVSLSRTSLVLKVGELPVILTATVAPDNATKKTFTWTSNNPAVATVTGGMVTAVAEGMANITVTTEDGGHTAFCTVRVIQGVTGVSLNTGTLSLAVAAEAKLTATVEPSDATDKSVTWTSSAPGVATVDADGNVTAVAEGEATITVTTEDGGKTAECKVTVPYFVTGVSLNTGTLSLKVNDMVDLTATVEPNNATNKDVTWESNNEPVAMVTDGTVFARAAGTATITVTTVDGNHAAECVVTVSVLPPGTVLVTGVSLNTEKLELKAGAEGKLTATVKPSNATNKNVTWTSNNPAVATVTSGMVTAVAEGMANIIVTTEDGGHTAICPVRVTPSVTGVSLNTGTLSLAVAATAALTATVEPNNATDKSVTWKSSASGVATVDANGKVTAVGVGTATITVTTVDGNHTATCTVTVTQPATGVRLDMETLSLAKGSSAGLAATVVPSNANQTVEWKSDDERVAKVTKYGRVTAVGAGTATITVTTADGNHTANCTVTVSLQPVTGVRLNPTSLALKVGETGILAAVIEPSNASNKAVTWTSSDTSKATVANGKITAVAAGTATITVKTTDGNYTATCTVTVSLQAVTDVSLNTTSLALVAGDTASLTATVAPGNATNKAVTWESDAERVATVDANGTVTAKAAGTATITVTTVDGPFAADCVVTVRAEGAGQYPVDSVKLTPSSLALKAGASSPALTVTFTPGNASNKNVTWASSDTAIATVAANGTVTAVAAGTATITVTTVNGAKTATCMVVVYPEWDVVSLTGGTITGDAAYNAGDNDTLFSPGKSVILSPFSIAKYETTYELWWLVKTWAEANGYKFANPGWEGDDADNEKDGKPPTTAKTKPVTGISWRDAIVWCNAYSEMARKTPVYTYQGAVIKDSTNSTACDSAEMDMARNGYRLPTEAEWEYAARGGGTPSLDSPFTDTWAGTNDESALGNYAWYESNAGNTLHPVGEKAANAAGLYDMSGNVFEWCWDWHSKDERVMRGGSAGEDASLCAVAMRNFKKPYLRENDTGFRVVCKGN